MKDRQIISTRLSAPAFTVLLLALPCAATLAQPSILDAYVNEVLANNPGLHLDRRMAL